MILGFSARRSAGLLCADKGFGLLVLGSFLVAGAPSVLILGLEARLASEVVYRESWVSLHGPYLGLCGIYPPDLSQSHGCGLGKFLGKMLFGLGWVA